MTKKILSFIITAAFITQSTCSGYLFSVALEKEPALRPLATRLSPEGLFKTTAESAEGERYILVLNCGSSSVKYQVIEMKSKKVLLKGTLEIGEGPNKVKDQADAVKIILDALNIRGIKPIAVGHRVVHGADKYSGSVLITEQVEKVIEDCIELAPLHNPANLAGIRACKKLLPDTPQVAVFDTAFHRTMPETAFRYAISDEFYTKYGIRKYGFHGTSHRYVAAKAAERLKSEKPLHKTKIITVHLGNGCSMTAVKGGKSIETSLGFSTVDGLVMGTRPGDLDPQAVTQLMRKLNLSPDDMDKILTKQSGLLGISGISNDVRTLLEAEAKGNKKAHLALEIFIYRVLKYIYAYDGILRGADAVVFTGGIGETNNALKRRIISRLRRSFNNTRRKPPHIYSIPTNEELLIARDTDEILTSIESARTTPPMMEEVALSKNRYREGVVTLAGVDAIDRLIEPTNIPRPTLETKEVRRMINRLAVGYIDISRTYEQRHGRKPIIAALSHNTFNPKKIIPKERENANVYIVDRAIEIARAFGVQFYGAGCLQLDAALMEEIARKKAGGDEYVKGKPDVFAFSSLHAYDIARTMLVDFPELFKTSEFTPETFDQKRLLTVENYQPQDPLARIVFERTRQADPKDLPIIVLGDGNNMDVLAAGRIAHKQRLARVVFMFKEKVDPKTVTNPDKLIDVEKEIDRKRVVKPENVRKFLDEHPEKPAFVEEKIDDKLQITINPKVLLKHSYVDGIVSGIDSPTSVVINWASWLKAGHKGDTSTTGVYDFCPLRLPTNDYGAGGLIFLLNAISLPASNAQEVAEMVPMAASDFEGIAKVKPKIALLIGPGKKPKKMLEAYRIIKERHGDLYDIRVCDMSTAIKERCNIFVPPDLATGNICYKLFERLLNSTVWGLDIMAMGKRGPIDISDLSRGADTEQVFFTILLVSLRISGRRAMQNAPATGGAAAALPVQAKGAEALKAPLVGMPPRLEPYTAAAINAAA